MAFTTAVVTTPPSTKKDRPFLGSAVVKGQFRFISVSQIVIFDPHQHGGCNRRFAFHYMFGKREEKTAAQLAGNTFASSQEHYLKTGEDVLEPELRAVKHFYPAVGPDLEVERDLGSDIEKALMLREALLRPENAADRAIILSQMRQYAGLVAEGIPLVGAPDYRHHRNEYVDGQGVLRKEAQGMVVGETVDLKMVSRIYDHTSKNGKVYGGRNPTWEKVRDHTQMVGYGEHDHVGHPNLTHLRLSHLYGQSKNGYGGVKVTGLVTVEENHARWLGVEAVVREMVDVAATATRPEDVAPNLLACTAFGKHQECPHAPYCDRPAYSIHDLLQMKEKPSMGNLFDDLMKPNGVAAPTVPPVPPAAPLSESSRAAVVAAEHARLLAEEKGCGALGCGQGAAPGWVRGETLGSYTMCPVCRGTGRPIGSVNPPDAPTFNPLAAAAPVPPEVSSQITDAALRAKVEAHAAAVAAQAPAQAAAAPTPKTSGQCTGGKQRVMLSQQQAGTKSYVCTVCGKELKIKPSADFKEATLPGHLMPKVEAPAAAAPVIPPAPPGFVSGTGGPAPVIPPAPPYQAPGALPGQLPMPPTVTSPSFPYPTPEAMDRFMSTFRASLLELLGGR